MGLFKRLLDQISNEEEYKDGTYEDKPVTLYKPFMLENDTYIYCVYANTSKGDTVAIKFGSPELADYASPYTGEENYQDPATPGYWGMRLHLAVKTMSPTQATFEDSLEFDGDTRTVQSVRDGVQLYYGSELGIEPYDKQFTVYRSPSTVVETAPGMIGLPVIEGHIDPDIEPEEDTVLSNVLSSNVVEFVDTNKSTTLTIRNKVDVSEDLVALERAGVRQFSMGYHGKLCPHDKFDYEQLDLVPRHLAVVDKARGGATLTFIDERGKTMHKLFTDADGSMNIQRVIEIARSLPEALKMLPLDQLTEMMPMMEEMMAMARQTTGVSEETPEAMDGAGEENSDQTTSTETEDQEGEQMENEEEKDKPGFTDSQVKSMVDSAIETRDAVIGKALTCLPEDYVFTGKSTNAIMRDVLATGSKDKFTDAELPIAFKLFKPSTDKGRYKDFGKPDTSKLDEVFDKEI